jgi:hypothetical protein
MPPRFPLGYKQDAVDYGYPSHRLLIAAVAPSLAKPDHLPFRKGGIWQGPVGMCVGSGFKRCAQLWQSMNERTEVGSLSGKFGYDIGRAAEFSAIDPDHEPELTDRGCQPGLLLRASREVGVMLDADYPDPDCPGWNGANVNRKPTIDHLVRAYDVRGIEFYKVSRGAFGYKESIRSCMVRRHPVMFSMFVDSGVMSNRGDIVTSIFRNDPDGGGHMLTVLDASRDDYAVIDNWWARRELGIEWGMRDGNLLGLPAGTWRIAWATLEDAIIQCFAFSGMPLIHKKSEGATP